MPEAATEAQHDRHLLERHRAGDRSAFEEFYGRYAGMIFNLALRQCGDRELARDLAQESLLRLYENLHKFEGRSSLRTWTYRVVLNHCRTRLSRRRPLQQFAVDAEGKELELEDERRGPESRTMASDSKRLVEQALLAVDLTYREAVILRDIEGLSYREIAEALEVPVGTVRSRIARGRERLRDLLVAEEAGAAGSRQDSETQQPDGSEEEA